MKKLNVVLVMTFLMSSFNSYSQPSFMKKYPLGMAEQELASELGGLMVDRSCTPETLKRVKELFGGNKPKCMMNNIQDYGANTMRTFFITDGIVKKGAYNFVDTTPEQQNFKNAWRKAESLVDGVKPTFIKEIKEKRTNYNRYYLAVWDWGKGFFTSNIMCTMIQIGNKWEFPKNIRNCYAFTAQFSVTTDQNKLPEDVKVNHIDF